MDSSIARGILANAKTRNEKLHAKLKQKQPSLPPDPAVSMPESSDVRADELIMLRHKLAEKDKVQSSNEKLIQQLFDFQGEAISRTSRLVASLPTISPEMRTTPPVLANRFDQLKQIILSTISPEHQWIYLEEEENWPEHLSRDGIPWTYGDPVHPTIEQLLKSNTSPVWAADKETTKELGRVRTAVKTLEYAETAIQRLIASSPEKEDDIKQFLKMTVHGNDKTEKKLQEAQAALSLVSTEVDKLPMTLVMSLNSRIQTSELLIGQYHDNVRTVLDKRNAMGIALNQTNQTTEQTTDLLKTFSGQGCMSFPQWKHESATTLESSGVSKALWCNILLKKVSAPASTKISQEAVNSKEVDRILADLERHYSASRVIAAAIFKVHMATGRIPDPVFDWSRSLATLIPHHEALIATEKFLKYSTQSDSEDSVYQFTPVNSLINLIPDRIRMDKDNAVFRANVCTSKSAKKMYLAFSDWVKETMASLQAWDVETQVSTTVHQSLIGISTTPDPTVLMTTSQGAAAHPQHAPVIPNQQTSKAGADSVPQQITSCPYCKALSLNSDWNASEASTELKSIAGFDSTHKQFLMKGQRYILPASGCLQFLLASPEIRRAAVQSSEICPTCLGSPRQKSSTGACKKKHAIAKRTDGRPNAICLENGCDFHHLICLDHRDQNKEHPHTQKGNDFLSEFHDKYPHLKTQGVPQQIALMTTYLDDDDEVVPRREVAPLSAAATKSMDTMITTAQQLASKSLSRDTNEATIFTLCPQNKPRVVEHAQPVLFVKQPEPNIKVKGRLWTEQELPECVTLCKQTFLSRNAPAHPADIIDRTRGPAVYLYIDLWAIGDRSIRTVFDSGATVSLWSEDVIMDGKLETRIDSDNPAAISGIGNANTKAITCDVVLPGNITNNHSGEFIKYWCRSTMVRQIIPPLLESDQTQLIQETISSIRQDHSVPPDMTVENFQTEIGGQIQGLIGAKHLQEFPVPVMHLSNGLSIFKHTLRPAVSRTRVYCIGGTLPALQAFKKHYGSNVHQISSMMLDNETEFLQNPQYDGDVRDPSVRSLPVLLTDDSFREEQGEEDCQQLDQATRGADMAPPTMQGFCATASSPKPP